MLPRFFNYKEENTDSGYEAIQDFYMSWLLRCSCDSFANEDDSVHEISKKITCSLLGIAPDVKITKVKTYRQWKKIDLLAEIEVTESNEPRFFVLNIENKWYSPIGKDQLAYNKQLVNEYYKDSKWEILNYVIFCDSVKLSESVRDYCQENDYKIDTISDMIERIEGVETSGNQIFDVFWFWK